jgi:MtaA/CmuA family methyltransferase
MNALERVLNRLEGKPVDRVPNLNIIMQFAAKYINVPYGKYCTDYKYLVEGNIRCCQEFGIDMVSAISDPFREAHGLGAEIIIHEDNVPSCKEIFLQDYCDIKKLRVKQPLSDDRMLDRIEAINLYQETVGKEFPILGWVEGAFAEACDLRGINNMMVDLYQEPEFVNELLEICLEQSILFAKEQINAGAHVIGIGDAAASLVGPKLYSNLILPFEKRLSQEIHKLNAKVKLHICGNINNLLEYLPLTTADIIDIDWMVEFKKAVNVIGSGASICGNIDPVAVLLQGSIDDVEYALNGCLNDANNNTFISAGCEVPKFTPYENMKAMADTLAKHV